MIKKDYKQQWEEKNKQNRQKKDAKASDTLLKKFCPMTSEQKRNSKGRFYSEVPKSKRTSLTPDEYSMILELREREMVSYDDIMEGVQNKVDEELEILKKRLNEYQRKREETYEQNLKIERERFGGSEYKKEIKRLQQMINNQKISNDKLQQELDRCNEYSAQQNRLLKFRKNL